MKSVENGERIVAPILGSLQTNCPGKLELTGVKAPEFVGSQFDGRGHMKSIKRPAAQPRNVLPRQIYSFFEGRVGHLDFQPEAALQIGFEIRVELQGLLIGDQSAKYVLSDRVIPLHSMEGGKP